MYDRKGALWKRWAIGFSDSAYHAPANQAAGIAIYTSASMLDVHARRPGAALHDSPAADDQ
ncbi:MULTISPECIES: hypothetical protein [unclassified Methylibium]|uniref:hypothetical protein n=1 Tax=unclassified Methylibium TaxID=2633235 RepID=UPI0004AC9AE3|nr:MULTISPECIES: hypothetical protein [unclassified Methylibium]